MEPEFTDDPGPMDDFERELRARMRRQPAPASLKRTVMERRQGERAVHRQRQRMVWFERIAASLVLAGVAGSVVVWHNVEEKRKGEEAKQQVFTALRIANHALAEMNAQLKEREAK